MISEQLNNHFTEIGKILDNIGDYVDGNYICIHNAHNDSIERNKDKILNLQKLVINKKKICEIGFNAGHSLLIMLDKNPYAEYLLFDINCHRYVEPCLDYIKSNYPNTKIEMIYGNSIDTLPRYISQNKHNINTFDLCHIDGSHERFEILSDFYNIKTLSSNIVIIDDYDIHEVGDFINYKIDIGEIIKIKYNLIDTNLHFIYKYVENIKYI